MKLALSGICLLTFCVAYTVVAVPLTKDQITEEEIEYPEDIDDATMSCMEEAITAARGEEDEGSPMAEWWDDVRVTIRRLYERHQQCANLEVSDPPRPWEEAAQVACRNAWRANTAFELNRLRGNLDTENAAETWAILTGAWRECRGR